MLKKFERGVSEKLKHYVYRLVDPRDGHTFYVGKGQGDRIFDHVRDAIDPGKADEATSEKRDVIQEILRDNHEPLQIVHRHGIETNEEARLVEAAVMASYMGLANVAAPKGRRYGPATVHQLNSRYAARTVEILGPAVRITITEESLASKNGDIYRAVRTAWPIGRERLRQLNGISHHVMVMMGGICRAVYEVAPGGWTPWPEEDGRYEFTGTLAAADIRERYIGRAFKTTRRPLRYCGKWTNK